MFNCKTEGKGSDLVNKQQPNLSCFFPSSKHENVLKQNEDFASQGLVHYFLQVTRYFSRVINPLVKNGFFHPYDLDESTIAFRDIKNNFSFLFHFSMKNMSAHIIAPDGTPCFAASHQGYSVCLCPKKGTRPIWVKHCSRSRVGVSHVCWRFTDNVLSTVTPNNVK